MILFCNKKKEEQDNRNMTKIQNVMQQNYSFWLLTVKVACMFNLKILSDSFVLLTDSKNICSLRLRILSVFKLQQVMIFYSPAQCWPERSRLWAWKFYTASSVLQTICKPLNWTLAVLHLTLDLPVRLLVCKILVFSRKNSMIW